MNPSMKRFIGLLALIALLIACNTGSKKNNPCSEQGKHHVFHKLLKAHVKKGLVDYARFNRPDLDKYLVTIANGKVDQMDRKGQLAFYINAYNAILIKQVLRVYDSVKDNPKGVLSIPKFFDQKNYSVAGQKISLNHLENKIIRPRFKEPRVHFALVCGALGCPILFSEAHTKDNLETLLNKGASRYLRSKAGLQIDDAKKILRISQIFEWYKDDFGEKDTKAKKTYVKGEFTGVRTFISGYRKDIKDKVIGYEIQFIPYNWRLNRQ